MWWTDLFSKVKDYLQVALLRLKRPKTRFEELEKQIEAIAKEVTFLNHYADIRRQFYLIVNQSPVAGERDDFWDLVHPSFAHELIIRLNRLYDRQFDDPDLHVYSLRALLLAVRLCPELLSR